MSNADYDILTDEYMMIKLLMKEIYSAKIQLFFKTVFALLIYASKG